MTYEQLRYLLYRISIQEIPIDEAFHILLSNRVVLSEYERESIPVLVIQE